MFHSLVTSDFGTYSGSISGIQFDKGFLLNSYQGTMADVDFNSAASTSLKSDATTAAATGSGVVLQGSTTITFNSGSMTISNDRKGWTNHVFTPTVGGEGIIYVQTVATGTTSTRPGTIFLNGGTLSGRMTIASEDDMTIAGNINYKTDPVVTPSSTDALGLLSMNDIWVGSTAPNNLEINAAMMATGLSSASGNDGSFGVTGYNSGSPRGNLTVYGGIVQENRGAVGQSSNGNPTHGYTKQYSYDARFINTPPPYYPVIAQKVTFAQWQEGH